MMRKGSPFMAKFNQTIRQNKNKIAQIMQKYWKFGLQFNECPGRGTFKPLRRAFKQKKYNKIFIF